MMHCIHFQHWIGKLDLEYVCNDQLAYLYKTQYMLLYSCQYLDIPSRWNQRTPSIGSKS